MSKKLALALFILDQFAFYFSNILNPTVYLVLRLAGSIAYPLFAYILVRSYSYSKNLASFFARLLILAVVSELIISYFHSFAKMAHSHLNPVFNLVLGFMVITAFLMIFNSYRDLIIRSELIPETGTPEKYYYFKLSLGKFNISPRLGLFLGLLLLVFSFYLANSLPIKDAVYYLALILIFQIASETGQKEENFAFYTLLSLFALLFLGGQLNLLPLFVPYKATALLAVMIMHKFKEEAKPSLKEKYFYYLIYPLHIIIFALARYFIIL